MKKLMALASGALAVASACRDDRLDTPQTAAEDHTVGEFYGVINTDTGEMQLSSNLEEFGTEAQGLFGQLTVDQNGRRGQGPANTVEVSTIAGTAGFGLPRCPVNTLCGDVEIGSRLRSPVANLTAKIVRTTPATGVVPTLGSEVAPFMGLSPNMGLFVYREVVPASPDGRRTNFTAPKKWGFQRFSGGNIFVFGKIYGDVLEGESFCGDGTLDEGEACDDGNSVAGDGCRANCTVEACGDGIVDPGEACDSTENCSQDCQIIGGFCGDGNVDSGEQCDDANQTAGDGCEPGCTFTELVVTPGSREIRPGGTHQFVVQTGTPGPFSWEVNGVPGGDSQFGTVDGGGNYVGPASVPNPSTFEICAVDQNMPGVRGCATINIVTVFTAGEDVVVFNDGNPFDDGALQNPNNVTMITNMLVYPTSGARGSATKVRVSSNRSSCLIPITCSGFGSEFTVFGNLVTTLGLTLETSAASLESIDADVRVLFVPLPTSSFTDAEINGMKAFAREGGRIVVIGEHSGFYPGIAFENELLARLGAQLSNVGDVIDCGYNVLPAASLRTHQITTGMTDVTIACSSQVIPGPNDQALYFDSTNTRILSGVAKIDTTPL